VDLHILGAPPSEAEKNAVDAVLGPPLSGWQGGDRAVASEGHIARGGHEARARRDQLLPSLHALMARVGWLSEPGLAYVCRRLTIPPAEAFGVATFYALFSTKPRAPKMAHLCDDLACRLAGAESLATQLEKSLPSENWMRSPCLGMCERAPAAMLTIAGENPVTTALAPVTAEAIVRGLDDPPASTYDVRAAVPQAGARELVLLRRVGVADPTSLESYRAHDGFQALEKARALGPEEVVRQIVASKLVGRGGAAFPTGKKWEAVARAKTFPHYLVCNADESEPGTFKDRVLLEEDPFAIVEAMTIAGFATGCQRGYVYLRAEYPLAAQRLQNAIALSRELLGGFEIEIRRGAGAYICGEETALFNSIEGYRGEPRSKPPFPVEEGLFHKPTVVNNVETLANVLPILLGGGYTFASIGTAGSSGPKLFCVSGRVKHPGLYEVPFGETLGQLIERAGGVGGHLRAVLLGGAAGMFVGPDKLDVPLTFEGTRAAGATLGSGVVMVFDDTCDLLDAITRVAEFFRHESCGQCVPCRVGTVRQEELVRRIVAGKPLGSFAEEATLLNELSQVMRDASICGLGQTASSAVVSGLSLTRALEGGS
jgi:NADH-quinone oxidoreductase subunit F